MDLQTLLPPGLTLDTFDGKAYVALVPFTMTGVRPVIAPPLPCECEGISAGTSILSGASALRASG